MKDMTPGGLLASVPHRLEMIRPPPGTARESQ
jgi:hypothetical protein